MFTALEYSMSQITKGIASDKKLYLVNGKSCSGKTTLINNLFTYFIENTKFNPFVLNGERFNSFFSLSPFNDFKTVKIPIENSKILVDFSNDNTIIHPHPLTDRYKEIFSEHKYIEKNKRFSHKNNLVIIDNCEKIDLKLFFCVNKAIKMIFNKNNFFGNIPLIMVGNSRIATNHDNIFSSALYFNHKNIYKKFNYISINSVETTFSNLLPTLEKMLTNKNLKTDKRNVGVLVDNEKKYFKSRDVEIHRKDLYFEPYFTEDYKEINNFNKNVISNVNGKKYIFLPSKLFKDCDVNKENLIFFNKYYNSLLKPLTLFDNARVVVTNDFPDLSVKKGDIGYLKKINLKPINFNVKNEVLNIDCQDHLKDIEIDINGRSILIEPKKIYNAEIGLGFIYIPLVLGYCIHFKYFTSLKRANVLLTKNINTHIVEACINKISDIGFKNTDLLNYPELFKLKYSSIIKNGN